MTVFQKCWWACCAVVLLSMVVMAFWTHPYSDDYHLLLLQHKYGFWPLQRKLYLEWQGRYTSSLFIPAYARFAMENSLYWLHPLLLLAATAITVYSLVKRLATFFMPVLLTRLYFVCSLLLLAMLFTLPSALEGYFWLTGALAYQPAFLLLCWLLHQWMGMTSTDTAKRRKAIYTACLLSLVIAGINEVALLLAASGWLFWQWSGFAPQHRRDRQVVGLFLLLGILIAVLSPGTWHRTADMGGGKMMPALIAMVYWPVQAVTGMLQQPVYWLLLVVLFAAGNRAGERNGLSYSVRQWIILFTIPVLALVPIVIASSGSLPSRLLNTISQYWVILSAVAAFCLGSRQVALPQLPAMAGAGKGIALALVLAAWIGNGYPKNLLQGFFFHRVMLHQEMMLREKKAAYVAPPSYEDAVKAEYDLYPELHKQLLWNNIRSVPELMGSYSDFENFNEHKVISLYYQTVKQ